MKTQIEYKTGDVILLNDFDLQCRYQSVGANSSEWIWYVSSNVMKRAKDAYDVKIQEISYYESDFILIENSGTTFKLEDNSIYILKAEYQAEKLVSNEVDFGIAVIFEGEEIPKFWINLSKDECSIENSGKGIQIFVSKLAIERAIKSYQEFSKFY